VLHLLEILGLLGGGLSWLADVAEQPQEVQMDAVQVLGIHGREPGGHLGPDIASLGTEAGVAEHVCHQGGKQVGHRHPAEPRLLGAKGKRVPGEGRGHDRESVPGIAPTTGGVGQERNEFMEFPDRPRPPVQQEQREWRWPQAWLVNEMQSNTGHGDRKMLKRVQLGLLEAPVVLLTPVRHERA
jgi:hypothetical protein